jgi:hypothetical protein
MFPIISALLAFVASLFRSRASLCLEHLALRHQLVVYKRPSLARASVGLIGCSGGGCLGFGGAGPMPWYSSSPGR